MLLELISITVVCFEMRPIHDMIIYATVRLLISLCKCLRHVAIYLIITMKLKNVIIIHCMPFTHLLYNSCTCFNLFTIVIKFK